MKKIVFSLLLWALAFLAIDLTPASAQIPLIGTTVNATQGFQVAGAAPSTHTLCGNGSIYVDSATPCTTTNIFYQTIDLNGTAQDQRFSLNFSSFFTAADSTSPSQTTIDPTHTGANKTCVNPTTMTVDVYGRTTACTAGGASSVLLATNGYEVYPSGHIHEWGSAVDAAGGQITVTFPLAFPHGCFSVVATDNFLSSSRIVSTSNCSTTTFNINNDGASNGEFWQADGW